VILKGKNFSQPGEEVIEIPENEVEAWKAKTDAA
jgi:hypothetical protein